MQLKILKQWTSQRFYLNGIDCESTLSQYFLRWNLKDEKLLNISVNVSWAHMTRVQAISALKSTPKISAHNLRNLWILCMVISCRFLRLSFLGSLLSPNRISYVSVSPSCPVPSLSHVVINGNRTTRYRIGAPLGWEEAKLELRSSKDTYILDTTWAPVEAWLEVGRD